MHVLHRPYLSRAIVVTALAAVLAIILTLAIAAGLNDIAYAPTQSSATSPVAATRTPATPSSASKSPFMRSPFSSLLTAPVTPPWAQDSR
jgi:hypothetical protein